MFKEEIAHSLNSRVSNQVHKFIFNAKKPINFDDFDDFFEKKKDYNLLRKTINGEVIELFIAYEGEECEQYKADVFIKVRYSEKFYESEVFEQSRKSSINARLKAYLFEKSLGYKEDFDLNNFFNRYNMLV